MLEISPNALAALGAQQDEAFTVKLAKFLHESIPAISTEAPHDVIAVVRLLIARARHYGLKSEQSLASFAIAAAYLGPDFDTAFPPVEAVMMARDMTEQQKIVWLEGWSTQLFEELEA